MIFTKSLLSMTVAVLQLASLSSAGIANRANSDAAEVTYSHDGRTCCTGGERGAIFSEGKCEYNSQALTPNLPEDTYVTKCCWNQKVNDFHVHFADVHEMRKVSPVEITGNATVPIEICNLGLKWNITEYILTDDYLDINVDLNIDCGPFNLSDREWIRIHFDSSYRDSGEFAYEISAVGPTIYATITSKIHRSDFSVDFHGQLTGTGILSQLDQSFDKNLRADEVAAILSEANIC
ncbi:hypothetical protein T069G_01923 [Trichoderma breve]|uniref:Uncharacterized protein n=1 Tax=Trichoderma breve TaxID=2034170 RepID=A0A9W9JS92_9HYPO|nr:hypothetical protein T069G_01923 [Trichoderma breve]KAJ4865393.1 hypothetical protein T069G_01923 [Trichoderma breve]